MKNNHGVMCETYCGRKVKNVWSAIVGGIFHREEGFMARCRGRQAVPGTMSLIGRGRGGARVCGFYLFMYFIFFRENGLGRGGRGGGEGEGGLGGTSAFARHSGVLGLAIHSIWLWGVLI